MRNRIMAGGLAAAVALPLLAAPIDADAASCRSRKTTGTILGGVGGALLGNAVSHGGGGAVIGGLGGAVVGHEIGRSGCRYRSTSYYRAPARRTPSRVRSSYAAPPPPARTVYYDSYGQPVSPVAGPAPAGYAPASYSVACRTTTRAFYDERGRLVERPVQVCDR